MKKDPKIFLHHILESMEEIENHIRNITEERFSKDIKTQDAVVRRIEIIGEATKNIPASFRKRHPEVDSSLFWYQNGHCLGNFKKRSSKIEKANFKNFRIFRKIS